eukprot:13950416-Heterocapsa_arctica.AAC.1
MYWCKAKKHSTEPSAMLRDIIINRNDHGGPWACCHSLKGRHSSQYGWTHVRYVHIAGAGGACGSSHASGAGGRSGG